MVTLVAETAPEPTAPASDADARPPDDDSVFRPDATAAARNAGLDPKARRAAALSQCEERLSSALRAGRPSALVAAIEAGGCTSLKGGACAKCRICPSEDAWSQVSGYYRAEKGRVFICAEKEPSTRQIEDTLVHELVQAYDHCRLGMRVPLVGWQAPWALTCAATACSEIRGSLLGSFQRHSQAGSTSGGFGGGSFGGGGFGGGSFGGGSSGTLMMDGNLPSGGENGEYMGEGGAALKAVDPDALRQAVYESALASTSLWGPCQREGRDPRATLDAVFNACMVDARPFAGAPDPAGRRFPPMPPEVDAADRGGTPGGSAMAPPPPILPSQPEGGAQPKWGEA